METFALVVECEYISDFSFQKFESTYTGTLIEVPDSFPFSCGKTILMA